MQVTADTITDEQVRELYALLDPDIESEAALRIHCSTALMPEHAMSAQAFPRARDAARRRCADAWNARHAT